MFYRREEAKGSFIDDLKPESRFMDELEPQVFIDELEPGSPFID